MVKKHGPFLFVPVSTTASGLGHWDRGTTEPRDRNRTVRSKFACLPVRLIATGRPAAAVAPTRAKSKHYRNVAELIGTSRSRFNTRPLNQKLQGRYGHSEITGKFFSLQGFLEGVRIIRKRRLSRRRRTGRMT
jgi:hypothetical protein